MKTAKQLFGLLLRLLSACEENVEGDEFEDEEFKMNVDLERREMLFLRHSEGERLDIAGEVLR